MSGWRMSSWTLMVVFIRTTQRPILKATIWQKVNEKGPFFGRTFSRPFKDQAGGWRNCPSFGLNDLEALVTVAQEAKHWIANHDLNS